MDSEGISFMTFQVSLSHIFRMRSTFPHDVFPLKQNVRGYTSVLCMYTVSTRDGGKISKRFRPQGSSDAPSRLGDGRRASNLGRPRPCFLLHFPQSAMVCLIPSCGACFAIRSHLATISCITENRISSVIGHHLV